MLRLTIEEHFRDLAEISEIIDQYLNNEGYINEVTKDGNITQKELLSECYSIFFTELEGFGIHLAETDSDIPSDFYCCKHFYHLRNFFTIPSLVSYFQNDDVLNMVSSYIDNDDNSFLLQDIINTIYEAKLMNQETYEILSYIENEYYTTKEFSTYIKSIIEYVKTNELNITLPDSERAVKYIHKVNELRKRAKEAVEKILEAMPELHPNMLKINKLLQDYDMDKLSSEELKIYALVDLDEVPVTLEKYKNLKMQIHHERSPHHIEYWLKPNGGHGHPTLENIILLTAHHDEPGTTQQKYWDEIEEMLNMGKKILTPEQQELIRVMGNVLYPITDQYNHKEKYNGIFSL